MLFGFGQVLCVIRAKGKRGGRRWRRGRRGTEVDNNELQREKTRTTSRRVRTMTRTRGRKKALTQYSNLKTRLQVPVGTIEVIFAVVESKTLARSGRDWAQVQGVRDSETQGNRKSDIRSRFT